MPEFSQTEIAIIALVAMLLFGSRVAPVWRSLARSMREFKQGLERVNDDRDDDRDNPAAGMVVRR
jgi:TatA/E family protein of Tat protein translocase